MRPIALCLLLAGCGAPSTFELADAALVEDRAADAQGADVFQVDTAADATDAGDSPFEVSQTDASNDAPSPFEELAPDARVDAGVDASPSADAGRDALADLADVPPDVADERAEVAVDAPGDGGPDASSADAAHNTAVDAFEAGVADVRDASAPEAPADVPTSDAGSDAGADRYDTTDAAETAVDAPPDVRPLTPAERCGQLRSCGECMAARREPDGSGCGWCDPTSRCLYGRGTCAAGWLEAGSICR